MVERWETDAIKQIRKETGMSRKRFSEKYGIPSRTIEDWEAGKRIPPEYVVDMLAKAVECESVQVTAWYVIQWRDGGGEQRFRTREEAVKAAEEEWNHMSEADRKIYDKPENDFIVAEFPLVWDPDEMEYIRATDDCDPVWDAKDMR